MNVNSMLLSRRGNLPRPVAEWNFGDFSKIQAGATSVDVAGWTGESLKAALATVDLTQTTAAAQPTFNTDHIEFDGIDDYLEGLHPQSGDFTYFIKYKYTGGDTFALLLGHDTSADQVLYINSNNISYRSDDSANFTFITGLDLHNGVTRTVTLTREGIALKLYIDGVFIGQTNPPNLTFQPNLLGNWSGSIHKFKGNMYNVLIHPTALSAVEIALKTASLA